MKLNLLVLLAMLAGLLFALPKAFAAEQIQDASFGEIAFVDEAGQIWLIQEDGNHSQQITTEGKNSQPTWSPDGSTIYFIQEQNGEIFFGSYGLAQNQENFYHFPDLNIKIEPNNIDPNVYPAVIDSRWSAGLSWSPNGEKIVYTSEGTLKILDLASGSSEPLTSGVDPSWRPATPATDSATDVPPLATGVTPTHTNAYIIVGEIWLINNQTDQRSQITQGTDYYTLDWSPDGQFLLALNESDQLDLLNINSGSVITMGPACLLRYTPPIWSPDSQKIIYQHCEGTDFQMRVVDITGETIIEEPETWVFPQWGQDSDSIFYFDSFSANQGLWQYDIPSQEAVLIYAYGDTPENRLNAEKVYAAPQNSWYAIWNYWSEGAGQVVLINSNGDRRVILTPESDSHGGDPLGDWSPDGSQFVFQSGNTFWATAAPIYIYKIEQQELTTLWQEGGLNPRWSPDGKTIAFTTWKGGLNLIDVDSQQVQVLLPDAPENALHEYVGWGGQQIGYFATEKMEPRWSPDGAQIIFSYLEGYYLLEVPTGAQQWVDQGVSPKWQPRLPRMEPTATPTVIPSTLTPLPPATLTRAPTAAPTSYPVAMDITPKTGESGLSRYKGIGVIALIALAVVGVVGAFFGLQRRKQPSQIQPAHPELNSFPPIQPATAQLIGIRGEFSGQTIPVFDGFMIGRSSECNLRLSNPSVSRLHAKLRFALNNWYLQDLGSQAGSYVNGVKIDSVIIGNGDFFQLGENAFQFRIG